jgi:hypothetical protein
VATVTPVLWICAGCVGSLAAVSPLVDGAAALRAAWAGMAAPLAATATTWIVIERAWSRDPARVLPTMLHAFALKIVFFLGYVSLALRVFALEPVPFVVSFTAYFLALYAAVAVLLQRRLARTFRQAR